MDYTESKFKSLKEPQQHKKCAELLRRMYTDLKQKPDESLGFSYLLWRQWMSLPSLQPNKLDSVKTLSDLYHFHLQAAGLSFKDHNLLSPQRRGDFSVAKPCWDIDIFLDHLRSAHNVGSIIRVTEASSLGRLFFSPQTPFIDNPKVQKTAKGCYEKVECFPQASWDSLKRPLIAIETSDTAASLYTFQFPSSFSIAVGNEEYGCSDSTLEEADYILEIPLRGTKNSLNVATAFACVAAEISRQKMQG